MIKYIPLLITVFFIFLDIFLYFKKINSLKVINKYFKGSNNALMLSLSSIQMIIKILEIQLINNKLQPEILEKNYNNSYAYHIETLNNRMKDYLSFKIQFIEFYYSFITLDNRDKLNFLLPQNYCIPDINGTKNFQMIDSIMESLNIISLNILYEEYPLQIVYNNSEYYFNDSMIKVLTKNQFFNLAESYILILDNFAKFSSFYYTEILNSIMSKIYEQIDSLYDISLINVILSCIYIIIFFIFFYIFLFQTKIMIKQLFLSHLTLRFFNSYLKKKTLILLDYFDNFTESNYYKSILNELEIIDENEEKILAKQILTDVIYEFDIIKIKPYSLKIINYFNIQRHNISSSLIRNFDIIENENKKSYLEVNSFSTNIKKSSSNKIINVSIDSNNINNFLPKYSNNFVHKIDKINRSSAEITFSNHTFSITKKLMPAQTTTTNLINPLNAYSLKNTNSSNSNNSNNTNYTYNTNSTNVNNEMTLSKSNIPLNDSTNRTNKGFLKLINENKHKTIKKYKTKNSVASQGNKDENDEIKVKFTQGGYKLLKKSILYMIFMIELIISIIIFTSIFLIEIILSKYNNNMFKSIIQSRNDIFQQFNFVGEMFIIYILSIINNKEVTISFIGNNLCYSCDESLKYKNIPEKNVYNYLNLCYPKIKTGVDNITLGKITNRLKYTRKFHLQINSENFCNIYSKFLFENSQDSIIPDLTYLKDLDLNSLINECENIGNGFNSKGLTTAFESIIEEISNQYKDFIADINRTEKSNYERLNNIYLINIQIEIGRVLRKVSVCYYIIFNWDYQNIENKIIRDKTIIYITLMLIIFFMQIIYIIEIQIFLNDLKKSQFFHECIMNTILFT